MCFLSRPPGAWDQGCGRGEGRASLSCVSCHTHEGQGLLPPSCTGAKWTPGSSPAPSSRPFPEGSASTEFGAGSGQGAAQRTLSKLWGTVNTLHLHAVTLSGLPRGVLPSSVPCHGHHTLVPVPPGLTSKSPGPHRVTGRLRVGAWGCLVRNIPPSDTECPWGHPLSVTRFYCREARGFGPASAPVPVTQSTGSGASDKGQVLELPLTGGGCGDCHAPGKALGLVLSTRHRAPGPQQPPGEPPGSDGRRGRLHRPRPSAGLVSRCETG